MNKTINKHTIIKYLNGELTKADDVKNLLHWVNSHEKHLKFFNEVEALWHASQRNQKEVQDLKTRIWGSLENKIQYTNTKEKTIHHHFNWKKGISIAAGIAIILSLGLFFWLTNSNTGEKYHTFYADAGSKSKITLSDGTSVYLNSETELQVPHDFGKNNRNVKLIGEAFFEVQKTENKSLFVVEVNELNIKVLGTEFNVKGYPGENTIETTLEEGKVVIEKEINGESREIISLKPNQQAVFIRNKGDIEISELNKINNQVNKMPDKQQGNTEKEERKEELILKEKIEPELYTSWKEGKFIFESERFDDLIVRMERWYGINIELQNDSLKSIIFSGILINETVEQALSALKMSQSFEYIMDIKNNAIYIE